MNGSHRMTAPSVSIILCTYNRKHLLPRALASVVRQTFSSWQLILIDDGSTDGSERLLLSFQKKEQRACYFRQPNHGSAHARNTGLKLATGTYVTFLDSDDEYASNHLEKRISFLRSHPEVDAIHGGLKPIGPKTKHYVPDVNRPGKKIHVSHCHAAGTLVAKRRSLLAIRGFRRIPFSEDYDCIQRLEKRFVVKRVHFRTYLYHLDSDNRLCDLYEKEGEKGILQYRGG